MRQTVVILGSRIGGLSAAHELAERGFEVRVFESKPIFGGKARSIPVPNSAVEGRKLLPGEHGFRFFPGFYRHVHDTMSRIPFRDNPRGVLDNLVPTTRTALARAGAPDMVVCSRFPRSRGRLEDGHPRWLSISSASSRSATWCTTCAVCWSG